MRSRAFLSLLALVLVAAPAVPPLARADEPAPAPVPADAPAPAPDAPKADVTVALVTGDKVNLRIGPRVDDAAVMQLDQGTVLLVVEKAGEWWGVQMLAGFSGAVAASLTEPVDDDHVRVVGNDVNLRRGPGLEQPPFRDHLAQGAVLPVLARDGEWIWVEAPEEIRAYVNAQYVKDVGPVAANEDRVKAGRAARAAREDLRKRATSKKKTEGDDTEMRREMGAIGKALLDLRAAGGYDVAPVATLEDRLEAAIATRAGASDRTKALARVLLEDLRRESEIRLAYADEILAKKRTGQEPPPFAGAPAPKVEALEVVGIVRYESAPGGTGDGVFVLWSLDKTKPLHALRWTGGDLKTYETGKPVRVKGKAMGGRLFGLPTVEVASVQAVPD